APHLPRLSGDRRGAVRGAARRGGRPRRPRSMVAVFAPPRRRARPIQGL
ncbi:MAG: hypothetical protein AVDCRST_MAG49-1217, partial [uncultured Thermomicrobiales bacterium]